MLERPDRETPGRDNVRPGLHALGQDVVWWDPRQLALDVQRVYGLRREDLILDPGRQVVEGDRRRYDDWLAAGKEAQDAGTRPSVRVRVVTQVARAGGGAPADDVRVIDAAPRGVRPAGPRFGTLVHAVLAGVALDAGRDEIADAVSLEARILRAPADEVQAATALVAAALAHPLMVRARDAWRAGRCRRETPVGCVEADGSLIEGMLDLAFEDEHGWTVVDFKTDADLAADLGRYLGQVGLYASMVARATQRNVTAALLRI